MDLKSGKRGTPIPPDLFVIKEMVIERVTNKVLVLPSSLQPFIHAMIKVSEWSMILCVNGGFFDVSISWIRKLLGSCGIVRRAITTSAGKLPHNFEEVKDQWLKEVAYIVATNKIPQGLVVNADQTGEYFY
jgi:hypothetical protein